MRTFEDFISHFKVIRRRGDTCDCLCTGHEDKQPSLQITQDGNKILVHCKAGCKAAQVMEGTGLSMTDLFLRDDQDAHRKKPASAMLKVLAEHKGLPENFLISLGVKQLKYFVRITYKLEDGSLASRQRIRFALEAKRGSKWDNGKGKPVPYGLWKLGEARKAGYLCVVEGESDSWTLWFHGFPALGLPGAEMAGTLEASYLQGISKIYVMQEPDKGGDAFVSGVSARLKKIGWSGETSVLHLEGVKDPNDLHKQNPEEFKERFQAAMDAAKPLDSHNSDQQNSCEIVDDIPDIIRRPLCIIKDIAYGATWLWIKTTVHETVQKNGSIEKHDPPLIREEQVLAIIRGSDAALFSDAAVPDAQPISKLGLSVILPEIPSADRIWSGAGVKRYLSGDRPKPDEVFGRLVDVVDRFMDFSRSLSNQQRMCELVACSVLATYLLDAFNVIGYQWPNGEKGTAKTKFLLVFCELAYLGLVVLAGGSYASLRDLADYGATLAFDDCEAIMDPNRSDPDKRALLLAGNRRGATITLKEPAGKRGWTTRQVNAFCPRLFSAIRLPDEILGSRTVVIPLVRSGDEKKVNADPLAPEMWPHDRRALIDDLWAMAVTHLPKLKPYNSQVPQFAQLKGRDLEPWRALLAVALWLCGFRKSTEFLNCLCVWKSFPGSIRRSGMTFRLPI